MLFGGSRLPSQRSPVVSNGSEDRARVGIEQAEGEIIRGLGFNLVGIEPLLWKVLQVLRDDDIGPPPDGGRQNVSIVGIGKTQAIYQRLEAHDQCVREMPIHCLPGSLELIEAEVGPVIQHVPHPFFMDHGTPAGAVEISVGEPQKRVSKAGRIDDVGVQKRSEPIHALLKAKFFIELGQFVERLTARTLRLTPVGEDILGSHPPVRANLSMRNLLLVEKLHEMRP